MPFLDFGTRFSGDICLYRLWGLRGLVERNLPLAKRGNCPLIGNKIFVSGESTDLRGLPRKQNNTVGPNNPLLVGDPPPRLPCEA